MIITSKSDYGLRAALYLSCASDGRRTLREIAESQQIPESICAQVMRKLVAAGLVISKAGPLGGYSLAMAPQLISVGGVLQAVDRDICIFKCLDEPDACELACDCVFRDILAAFGRNLTDYLDQLTLADLQKGKASVPAFLPFLPAASGV